MTAETLTSVDTIKQMLREIVQPKGANSKNFFEDAKKQERLLSQIDRFETLTATEKLVLLTLHKHEGSPSLDLFNYLSSRIAYSGEDYDVLFDATLADIPERSKNNLLTYAVENAIHLAKVWHYPNALKGILKRADFEDLQFIQQIQKHSQDLEVVKETIFSDEKVLKAIPASDITAVWVIERLTAEIQTKCSQINYPEKNYSLSLAAIRHGSLLIFSLLPQTTNLNENIDPELWENAKMAAMIRPSR